MTLRVQARLLSMYEVTEASSYFPSLQPVYSGLSKV